MDRLLEKLAAAIIRMEGQKPDFNNPLNLRDAVWVTNRKYVTRGKAGRFWDPASRKEGLAGGLHLLALRVASGWSLRQLINSWAPASDGNNVTVYVTNVAKWTGISNVDQPLLSLIEEPAPLQ